MKFIIASRNFIKLRCPYFDPNRAPYRGAVEMSGGGGGGGRTPEFGRVEVWHNRQQCSICRGSWGSNPPPPLVPLSPQVCIPRKNRISQKTLLTPPSTVFQQFDYWPPVKSGGSHIMSDSQVKFGKPTCRVGHTRESGRINPPVRLGGLASRDGERIRKSDLAVLRVRAG